KFTTVSTADLGGNANGAAVRGGAIKRRRSGDQDRFDEVSIAEPKEKFSRRVLPAENADGFEIAERKLLREPFAQRLRQIAHRDAQGRSYLARARLGSSQRERGPSIHFARRDGGRPDFLLPRSSVRGFPVAPRSL